jgi:hypothetical protein
MAIISRKSPALRQSPDSSGVVPAGGRAAANGAAAWRWVAETPVVDLGRTSSRLLRLRGCAAGFVAAAAQPLDPGSTGFALGATSG